MKTFRWDHNRLQRQRQNLFIVVVTLGQKYNVGEKPTLIILYTYINRRAETPSKTKTKDTMSLDRAQLFTLGLG